MSSRYETICPRCGSRNIQAGKRGFNTGRAITGGLLTGDWLIAIAAGGIGANKTELTCLNCGHTFNIDESENKLPSREDLRKKHNTGCLGIIIPLIILSSFLLFLVAFIA